MAAIDGHEGELGFKTGEEGEADGLGRWLSRILTLLMTSSKEIQQTEELLQGIETSVEKGE